MRRAPTVSFGAATNTLRVDPARSSTGLAGGRRGLGQRQQVGNVLRCVAPMSYPCGGETLMGGDEAARNTVQPSMHRSVPCCASPRRRDAQVRAPLAPPRPRRRPGRAARAMFPSARCCTRWCRRTTRTSSRVLRPKTARCQPTCARSSMPTCVAAYSTTASCGWCAPKFRS